jgi:predicted nucleic acid-binding protein
MLRFFDSTGLVKALIRQELGHAQAASLLEQPGSEKVSFATARIAALEAISKIWRVTRDRRELQKLEHHFDKFAFYELDADYALARDLILKTKLKGADAGILSVAVGISRRERIVVQFISADQDQLHAARRLGKHDKIRIVALPGGLA